MYKDDQTPVGISADSAERFVLEHGDAVLRVARAYCKSSSDAEDVYQRTLEILMLKAPAIQGAALVSWACTVARNEALMLYRKNSRANPTDFEAMADAFESELPTPDDLVLDDELLGQGREILARLRPDQTRCLLLRADDLGYDEICEKTGFSYAKVNRLLSEGRKAMLARHELLVSGSDCRRLEDSLSMFADGAASAEVTREIEMHIEHCMGCRATVRDYRDVPGRVAGFLPVGILVTSVDGRNIFERALDQVQGIYANVQERLFGHVASGQQAAEVSTAKKLAIVGAIGGSLIVGGAAIEGGPLRDDGDKPPTQQAPAPQGAASLVDAVELSAADRRKVRDAARSRLRPRDAEDSDVIAAAADGRDAVETNEPVDNAVPQDQAGFAADPADQAPEGAEDAQAPENDGFGGP